MIQVLIPNFFIKYQISCNIQTLSIENEELISDGLIDLISLQNGIKNLSLIQYFESTGWNEIIPSLMKHSNSLIKLEIYGICGNYGSLSFITKFTNLQEIVITIDDLNTLHGLDELQYTIFPQLSILKFRYKSPSTEVLTTFLENHGKNLLEFHCGSSSSLNLIIAKFCLNLRSLFSF